AALATGAGCGSKDTPKATGGGAAADKDKDKGSAGTSSPKKDLTAMEAKGKATLKGQVTYAGDPPQPPPLPIDPKHADAAKCKKGEGEHTLNLTWEVDPNSKGVKNVVVWVRPGDGTYFAPASIPDALKNRKDAVKLEQPFCNYIPHVLAYNPSIFDG